MTDSVSLDDLEIAHARFNALKTVASDIPSEFETTYFGPISATRDTAREDSYYNRILGFPKGSDAELDQALLWIADTIGTGRQIRLDVPAGHGREQELKSRGFDHTDTIVWLIRTGQQPDSGATASPCRELSRADWPAIRVLLEAQGGPIDSARWHQKRPYLCTDSFRWFGVFDGDALVSAGSLWIDSDAAISGSAFTLPQYRGRGYQRVLLDLRCKVWPGTLMVDVEPGSTSHRNCLRSGFEDLETRQIWTHDVASKIDTPSRTSEN